MRWLEMGRPLQAFKVLLSYLIIPYSLSLRLRGVKSWSIDSTTGIPGSISCKDSQFTYTYKSLLWILNWLCLTPYNSLIKVIMMIRDYFGLRPIGGCEQWSPESMADESWNMSLSGIRIYIAHCLCTCSFFSLFSFFFVSYFYLRTLHISNHQ